MVPVRSQLAHRAPKGTRLLANFILAGASVQNTKRQVLQKVSRYDPPMSNVVCVLPSSRLCCNIQTAPGPRGIMTTIPAQIL